MKGYQRPCPYRVAWEDAVRQEEILKTAPVPDRQTIRDAHRTVMIAYSKWFNESTEPEAVAAREIACTRKG